LLLAVATGVFVVINDTVHLTQLWGGFLASWVYLRFYKIDDAATDRGDPSEAFSFASFFPERIQCVLYRFQFLLNTRPFIKPFSNLTLSVLIAVRCCQRPSLASAAPETIAAQSTAKLDLFEADMDRRKALALKTLESRLQTMNSNT
jgi:hypothetical protein